MTYYKNIFIKILLINNRKYKKKFNKTANNTKQ